MAIATPENHTCMGGYEYQFVEIPPPDWLICNICHHPSKSPCLSLCCGNVFCKSCLDGANQSTVSLNNCPLCRDEEFNTIPHKQADRAVRSLHIFCVNKEKGCEWQGEINNINNHLENKDGCQYEDVQCSNDSCGKMLQRRLLGHHEQNECLHRKVYCEYCSDVGAHTFITGEHIDLCPKFPMQCSNSNCTTVVFRKDVDEHRKTCPYEVVDCCNGCGLEFQRQKLNNHNKKCSHRTVKCQYCHITGKHLFIQGEHKEQCPKLPISCPNKCNARIPRDDSTKHADVCPMKSIQCEYFTVGCEKMIILKDQKMHNKTKVEEHLSLTVNKFNFIQQELTTTKQQLEQKLATSATTFQEELSKLENKFQLKVAEVEATAEKKINELEIKLQKKAQQLEKMHINEWAIEIISNSTKLSFGNQTIPVVVRMSDFAKKKKDHVEWYSDSFYTHENGYKICLRVHAAGWSKGCATHLSLILCLLAGPFDDNQSWPIRREFKVKLLNQISDTEHHSEAGPAYNIKRNMENGPKTFWSRDQYISNEILQNPSSTCQFLKNDTIFFEVHTHKLK